MYIREIHIENIRGFGKGRQGVHLDLTRPDGSYAGWTVIAGVNGSGKTTFLRALALSVSALSTALSLEESYAGWVRQGARIGRAKARVVRTSNDRYRRNGSRLAIKPDELWTGLEWAPDREPMLKALVSLNPKEHQAGPALGPCADNPSGWFIAGYGPFRRLLGEAPAAQRLMRGPIRIARLVSLFREDATLVESIKWLQQVDYRSKERGRERQKDAADAEELKQAVIKLLGDGLLPRSKVKDVNSDGLWVERDGVTLLHTQLSDGYKTVTALVLDIVKNLHDAFGRLEIKEGKGTLQVEHAGVVLIDEIDAHLHVSWQKRIGVWLKEHFPHIQFIVTTHSPFICQAADPHGLIRLAAPGDVRQAERAPEDIFNTVVNGTADDAVMSELFGKEPPYSDQAEELRDEITKLEARVIEGEATEAEKVRLSKLSGKLPSTPNAQIERALLNLRARLDADAGEKR